MKITTKLIDKDEYITTEWSGGKTTQLFIYPEDSSYKNLNFKFRLSSATVELEESRFTKLEGIYRFITPLDKELKLTHDNKEYINLKPFEVYEFDGGINTSSYGTVRDFNLMLGNGAEGKLESIHIDKNYSSMEVYSSEFKEIFYIIYAYRDRIHIHIDGDKKIIEPLQTFIIKLTENLNLKISSENPTDVLISKIYIMEN